jgi:hypothetical protein
LTVSGFSMKVKRFTATNTIINLEEIKSEVQEPRQTQDFQQLNDDIDRKWRGSDLANRLLGLIDGTRHGNPTCSQSCPLCGGADSFYTPLTDERFHCTQCGFKGTIVFLVALVRKVSIGEAYDIVSEALRQLDDEEARRAAQEKGDAVSMTRLTEKLRQITIDDVPDETGWEEVWYIPDNVDTDWVVSFSASLRVLTVRISVEVRNTTEHIYFHWVKTDEMRYDGRVHLAQIGKIKCAEGLFLPQPGDRFCALSDNKKHFRVAGWQYEPGTEETIIRLEAEPVGESH